MELQSCCGILSLQVGVAMVSVLYWLIGSLIFVVNFFDFLGQKEFPFYAFPIMLFVILFIAAGSLAYASAFRESYKLCKIAVAVMVLTLLLFLIFSAGSFVNSSSLLKYICVHTERCPESFWLASLRYRKGQQHIFTESEYENTNSTESENMDVTPFYKAGDNAEHEGGGNEVQFRDYKKSDRMFYDVQDDHSVEAGNETHTADRSTENPDTSGDSGEGYIMGVPFYGAVFLFLTNCIILIYTAFLVWSYGKELIWIEKFLAGMDPD